ncbi:pentatricopeptide repeat-containing protein At2g13600-like isoform X2 [Dioscorea cayenensis subsp. rotundata]|uniref:Pentatricopeptide repeat-containing protein At2g13600-like isoform X2 n=1 Tax=Dioscorea cayennensis subsp. rotundata TaxID=55577 RepID=A0AB40AUG8_DIOCR|nr:pentatricopeptide repeat-containing protein At2g13600-like isoform X2 [Dioscorea cayenensis subsp. rotundata]
MFRSILNASITTFVYPSLSHVKLRHFTNPRVLPPFTLHNYRICGSSSGNHGSMMDVFRILGPLDCLFPSSDRNPYVTLLRRCIKTRNFVLGGFVHSQLIKLGLENELMVSNVLLDLYAKLGLLDCGLKLFDEMLDRDLISWCTLISGFVAHGFELEAYGLFRRMLKNGVRPNHFVISSVLKGCAISGVLRIGVLVHGLVIKGGLGFDRFVEIALVGVYAKCGSLDDALKVFYEIPVKSPVAWNAMISGYVCNGFLVEAAEMCQEMCRIGFVMDLVTLRVIAGVCSSLEMPDFWYHFYSHWAEAIELAKKFLMLGLDTDQGAIVSIINICQSKEEMVPVHAQIIKAGYLAYLSTGNALISSYAKFGVMVDAFAIFYEMPVRDVVSWTAIMTGLVKNARFREALECFRGCWESGTDLDQYSIITTINACTGLRAMENGRQIHALALKLGVEFSSFMVASLLHLYAKCGHMDTASKLFNFTSYRQDLIQTNIMLAGYYWNSQPRTSLDLFSLQYRSGLVPDNFSFSTTLNACAASKSLEMGEQLHCCIMKSGYEFSDIIIGNAIIHLYVKSGRIDSACKFFYGMKKWDVNMYAMLMLGYIQQRGSDEDVQMFRQIQLSQWHGGKLAFARILRGSSEFTTLSRGKQALASDIKMGFISDVDASVSFHDKIGQIDKAGEILDEMPIRDDTCDPLISSFALGGDGEGTFRGDDLYRLQEENQEYHTYINVLNLNPCVVSNVGQHGLWRVVSFDNSTSRKYVECP